MKEEQLIGCWRYLFSFLLLVHAIANLCHWYLLPMAAFYSDKIACITMKAKVRVHLAYLVFINNNIK